MPLDLIALSRTTDIKNNIGGVAEHFWIAPANTFDALKGPKVVWAAVGDSVTIDGDHTFPVGKGFVKVQLDYQKNMFEGAKVGEFGSNNKEYTVKGIFHGLSAEA